MLDYFFPDLSKRIFVPELMDLFESDKKKLVKTVRQFKMINHLFSRSKYYIKKYIIQDMLKNPGQNYTLLDIGIGGCDLARWLIKKTRKLKLKLKITGIDYDVRVIECARKICENFTEIDITNLHANDLEKLSNYDYIFANHFLHHLKTDDILPMLEKIQKKTKKIFLLNDLERSNSAFFLFTLFAGLFLHHSFSYFDGRLSIKKGFKKDELSTFIMNMNNSYTVQILQAIPARILILGEK